MAQSKENDFQKDKILSEKRHWLEQMNELETRLKSQEQSRLKEFELKIKALLTTNENLQNELEMSNKKIIHQQKEFEGEMKKASQEKMAVQEEISNLQSQGMKHALELNNLKSRLEEAKTLEQDLLNKKNELSRANEQASKEHKENEELKNQLSAKNSMILRLKEEIKKRDIELDSKDEETTLRV
jgi:hypothetical protein